LAHCGAAVLTAAEGTGFHAMNAGIQCALTP
jgi:hypothetical protein